MYAAPGANDTFRLVEQKRTLAAAVAASLGIATGDALASGYYVTLKGVTSYSGTGSLAGNVGSSTAVWFFDKDAEVIIQAGGTFDVRFIRTPLTTLFRHSTTGLVIGNGAAATAATFICTEGNFGPNLGVSVCGNYNFGANFINESTASWGPGTTTARNLGGDDWAVRPEQSLAQYDGFYFGPGGTALTFVLSNATCDPLALGNANGCAALGGKNAGYTWTFDHGRCILADPSLGSECNLPAPVVPVPAAAWLFGSALGVLGWVRRVRY